MDHGVDDLWQWNKISDASHFPKSYLATIAGAEHLVLVRSSDPGTDCPIVGRIDNVYLNETLRRLRPYLWESICSKLQERASDYHELRQWEWGLPDSTINAARSLWHSLGKDDSSFHLIEAGTVDLYRCIPVLWERYLQKNTVEIHGVTLNAYWVAHPYYEREAGLIPIHYYSFSMLQDTARTFLEKYGARKGQTRTMCAFTNDAGSPSDSKDVWRLISALGLEDVFWFSNGFDCPDAECRNARGKKVPKPHEKISSWMATAPYRSRKWTPMEVDEVCKTFGG